MRIMIDIIPVLLELLFIEIFVQLIVGDFCLACVLDHIVKHAFVEDTADKFMNIFLVGFQLLRQRRNTVRIFVCLKTKLFYGEKFEIVDKFAYCLEEYHDYNNILN